MYSLTVTMDRGNLLLHPALQPVNAAFVYRHRFVPELRFNTGSPSSHRGKETRLQHFCVVQHTQRGAGCHLGCTQAQPEWHRNRKLGCLTRYLHKNSEKKNSDADLQRQLPHVFPAVWWRHVHDSEINPSDGTKRNQKAGGQVSCGAPFCQ